ncbi:Kinase [Plasmodiophora brassicae]|uniref:Kinase n=1 Tax=Plasmodiophora brassicae TaxID=37360 RepID=A0A3P3YE21_PLABS|nr:unnamed protein product [Plasmodiophora brassicae]
MAASLLVGLLICRGAALSMDVHLRDLDHDLIDVDRIVPFAHQVGGHRVGDGNAASRDVALIRDDNGQHRLLKPLQPDERGVREALFYRTISQEFARFIPKYYGLYRMPGTDHFHVSLQNCIGHMRSPCIADIKIGRVTYDHTATPDKVLKEVANYRWQSEIGFRFVGVKTYRQELGKFDVYDKPFGKSIHPGNVDTAWSTLFCCGHAPHVQRRIIRNILSRLAEIAALMRAQSQFKMYSSSLLVAYEGHPCDDDVDCDPPASVHMIDFGHAFPIEDPNDRDHNYLFGLERLIASLEAYHRKMEPSDGT